eukprot:Nitzschia sp. Nitz4//scaffold278_size24532//7042//7995//NITZ4_008374-RA/size24532-processed-gene-0.7-mRNA-1//-1//CDS//3329545372//7268//frame0
MLARSSSTCLLARFGLAASVSSFNTATAFVSTAAPAALTHHLESTASDSPCTSTTAPHLDGAPLQVQLRLASLRDIPAIHRCNLACLPENYNAQFYAAHLRHWPELAIVAEDMTPLESDDGKSSASSILSPLFRSFPGAPASVQPPEERRIVGYVLGKLEEYPISLREQQLRAAAKGAPKSSVWNHFSSFQDSQTEPELPPLEWAGHVTSLAVLKEYRRLGLAQSLMSQLHAHLQKDTYYPYFNPIRACGLHVRASNHGAWRLYQNDGYAIHSVIPSYYQDGEDAYWMRKALVPIDQEKVQLPRWLPVESTERKTAA